MRIPDRDYVVAQDLRCVPTDIDDYVVQDNLIRHPFGIRTLFGRGHGARQGKRRFDLGWEAVAPPVLTSDERLRLTTAIKQLEEDGKRCAVPRLTKEVYGGDPPPMRGKYCLECLPPLVSRCATLCHEIARRYFGLIDRVLEPLEEEAGVEVLRTELLERVMALFLRSPQRLEGLVVLSLGFAGRDRGMQIAWVNAWDGVRAEFVVHGRSLRWRATYARTAQNPSQRAAFLLAFPAYNRTDPPRSRLLSETCWVPRSWWKETGDVA